MSAVTQTQPKLSPIQYLRNLSATQTWDNSQTELKRVYQLIRSRLTAEQQDTLLIEIYNNISYSCGDGLCTYWRYMNN